MSFRNWINNILPNKLNQQFNGFFYKLGEGFSFNSISDQKATQAYLTYAAWYSIVKTCAEGVASLPFTLATGAEDDRTKVTEGEVYDFFFKPNDDQTLQELVEMNMIYYFSNGEFYEYNLREVPGFMTTDGRISLPPELVTVNKTKDNSILAKVRDYSFMDGAQTIKVMPEDMLHVLSANPSVNGRTRSNGLSPLQAAQHILNTSGNIETAMSWYFENRGASTIISSAAGNQGLTLTKDDRHRLEAANVKEYGGAHKMNRVITSQVPITATQLNASSTDMQMVDNYNLIVERLCALVGLPAILVQVNENSTYNNVREAYQRAYKDVFIPNANKLISGYNRKYCKEWNEVTGQDYSMYIDTTEIEALKPTPNETREQNRLDVDAGIMTPNEARAKSPVDLEPSTDPKADELHFKNDKTTTNEGN